MKRFLLLFGIVLGCLLWGNNVEAQGVKKKNITTIIMVRHAEKVQNNSVDPNLSREGVKRANLLAFMLENDPIKAIYSTDYVRTKKTAQPTSAQKKITVEMYDSKQLELFLDQVIQKHAGETVLVVGHSNTVPKMLNLLTNSKKYKQIADEAYNDLFVIGTTHRGNANVTHLMYGNSPKKKGTILVDDDGLALEGYDPVAYFKKKKAVLGQAKHTTLHKGVRYNFSKKAYLKRFLKNPEAYLPQYGGWCAMGLVAEQETHGYPANRYTSDPNIFAIIDGKLYLFFNDGEFNAHDLWIQDAKFYIGKADDTWTKMK